SRAHARRVVDDRLRRQMVGQGSAGRRLALLVRRGAGLGRLGRVRLRDAGARERLGDARFDIVDHELELLDLRIELLRLAAEAGATKNGELGAQLLDHQRLGADLGPEPGDGTPTISTTPARRKLQSPKSRLEPRTKRFLLFGQVVFALVDGLPTVFTI